MPVHEKRLETLFKGKHINEATLKKYKWFDQGSDNYHFGFPRKEGLWLIRLETEVGCCSWPILFLMTKNRVIKKIFTMVCENHNDGSYDEIEVPFFDVHIEQAKSLIEKVIK
ncbi:MAG: hypothetical protein WCI77_06775 [Candidatus Omnitrophota bacterium]